MVNPSPPVRRPSRRRRSSGGGRRKSRRRSGGASGTNLRKTMMNSGIGGFIVGFIEKTWGEKIPSLPWVGRKGAVALGIYALNPKNQILKDTGIAAAAISGYEFGKEGSISGDDEEIMEEI